MFLGEPKFFASITQTSLARHQTKWTVADVPGDGNCWIYSVLLSLHFSNPSGVPAEPQDCREKLGNILENVSFLPQDEMKKVLSVLNFYTSAKVRMLYILSKRVRERNVFSFLAIVIRIGAPYKCIWAGDIGDELVLLSSILRMTIVTFKKAESSRKDRHLLLSSKGMLKCTSYYKNLC